MRNSPELYSRPRRAGLLIVEANSATIRNMSNYRIKDRLPEMFKALSNPHRLALFHRLMTCCVPGTCCAPEEAVRFCVGELAAGVAIAPSTLSHHLKELNRAGLVKMERRGKQVDCWVEPEILDELAAFFTPLQPTFKELPNVKK